MQINSLHFAEDRAADNKDPDSGSNHTSTSSYTPNVFRGINTSGSYHVYGDTHAPGGQLEGSHKSSDVSRGGALSQNRCSQVTHSESTTTISHPVLSHPGFSTPTMRPSGAQGSYQRPATPMDEDSIQHPQSSCLRLSPGFVKGVICSPQSPLRSDCQPNSPTESNSSKNAMLSLKQPSDCPSNAKARNWKKYKLIVMNQTPDENEAQGGGNEAAAMSPTLSPFRSSETREASEVQAEEGVSEHREEIFMSQSVDTCNGNTCRSIR